VLLSVRPEDIVLEPQGGGYNHLTGVVEEVIFLGDALKFVIKLDRGGSVVLKTRRGTGPVAAGDRVRLGWPLDASILHQTIS
jgi:hypothetical protein